MAKHKKTVTVVHWCVPGRHGFAVPSEQTTAETLSSQEAEAQIEFEPDLQTQVVNLRDQLDLFTRQVASDMQERIQHTATLVIGRLVRAASTRQDEESDKNALTNYVSTPLRKCKIRDWLVTAGSQQSPEAFAEKFDGMYSDRCAKEHPTDWSLAKSVEKVRAQPLYSFVQAQGNCVLECTVLDNFQTLKPMFI